jgi:predicted ATPase
MSLGLCGAHRTGKSTLAEAFAKKHDLVFVRTGATEVFARLGLDPKAEYPIDQRISIQSAILYAFEQQWMDASRRTTFFVSDRTPIDLASYLLADVSRQTLAGRMGSSEAINRYTDRCLESANRFFSTIILVQPGIPVVEAEGKAPADPAYMEHLNSLQLGLLTDQRTMAKSYYIKREHLTIEERIASVEKCLHAAHERHALSVGRLIEGGFIRQH